MRRAEAVIVGAVRTPIGRGHPEKGWFRDTHATQLLADAYLAVLERTEVPAGEVQAVVAGCAQAFGEQSANVARNAWLRAGLPVQTPATTVDCACGSSQQAVNFAAALIGSGVHDVVLAAGVEHMGHVPLFAGVEMTSALGTPWPDELHERHDIVTQGVAAERITARWEIPRAELDELALRSHRRAQRATEEGRFEREIAPVRVGEDVIAADQGIRPDTTLEALAALPPSFEEEGSVTAGNSSQVSDGAAAVLLMERRRAEALGLHPRARIVDQVTVAVDPAIMLTGPIPATRALLERNGMTIADVDLVEINEAFASVVAAWSRELGPDPDRVNVNGGAIALGHPLGSTGARLVTTLLHELERSDRATGLVTMCAWGGMGTGTLIERI